MGIALVEQGAVNRAAVMGNCPMLPTLGFVRALAEVSIDRQTDRQKDRQTDRQTD